MRVRALSETGDMTFGRGVKNFLVDSKEAVAQIAQTRMGLWQGDWYQDLADGTRYRTAVLGMRTITTRDPAIRSRLLGTPGVTGISSYSSAINKRTRQYGVAASLNTQYGTALVATTTPAVPQDVRYGR